MWVFCVELCVKFCICIVCYVVMYGYDDGKKGDDEESDKYCIVFG